VSEDLIEKPVQQSIREIEAVMRNMPQQEIPVEHTFGPGFYARTIRVPAGTTLVGEEHATEHIFMVTKGSIALAAEGAPVIVSAGFQMVCKPGLKRIGHALEETVCTNIHITEEKNLDALRAQLIVAPALPCDAPKKEIQS